MHSMRKTLGIAASFSVLAVAGCATPQYPQGMTFFITSVGTGKGADLGGIEGADRHCQSLAAKVGADSRTWRAYLSTQGKTTSDTDVAHARNRIGEPGEDPRGDIEHCCQCPGGRQAHAPGRDGAIHQRGAYAGVRLPGGDGED